MPRLLLFLCVFLLLPVAALRAESVVETLERGATSRAVEIVDGDTLVLENGAKVRLVGIQSPKLPLGRAGFEAWPLAEEAKQALEGLALGQTLTLYYGGIMAAARPTATAAPWRISSAKTASGCKARCWRPAWRGSTAFATTVA